MLAAMVRAGELPPVDERLPSNPLVVEPFDSIGTYGGTVRMMDVADSMSIGLRVRHTGLFRYNQTASQFEADLAASHAWSNNNRTLTLTLRDGLRWSDGEPFTTADLMFKWEHEILNEEIHPRGIDPFWTLGGERAGWEPLDDSTLRITWAAPNPVAMDRFGRTHFSGDNSLFLPAHYLEQFHTDFNDDDAALAAELGFDDWIQMFNDRRAQGYNQSAVTVGRPYMDFHVPEVVESNRVLLVRNPYYHHVDTANNQLPYVDRLEIFHVGDKQLYDLKASAGEADFVAYYTGAPSLPTYKAGEAQGDAAGLSERDGDGFRLRPDDGKRLNLVIEIGVLEGPKQAICELISNDWRQVGIEGACKLVDGALQSERLDANETAITAWHLGRTTLLGRGTPDQFAFERCGANNWGRQWCFWFVSGGDSGMEPPAEIKALNERWQAFKQAATGTPDAARLGKAYFAFFADELPMIPTIGLAPHPVIIHNRLKNVPADNIFWGSDTNFYAPYKPEQWYIAE